MAVISPHQPGRLDSDTDLEADVDTEPTQVLDVKPTEEEGELSKQDKDSYCRTGPRAF